MAPVLQRKEAEARGSDGSAIKTPQPGTHPVTLGFTALVSANEGAETRSRPRTAARRRGESSRAAGPRAGAPSELQQVR